jgi:hypothetical protein
LNVPYAPNFGPHGNFGLLFQKGLLSLKRVLQENEHNKSCGKHLDLHIRFYSFLVHDSSKEATELAKIGPKFPQAPKLEAFTVLVLSFGHLSFILVTNAGRWSLI